MRIAVSGASCVGKSTLISQFLRRWPMYVTPKETYRDALKNNPNHSSRTNEETQLEILNWMLQEQDKYPKGSNVIYDRCPLDNLVYTLQANESNLVSDAVTAAVIDIVKASLKHLDIIFWLRYEPEIKIVGNGMRDTDVKFIRKTDQIFSDLYDQYSDHLENSPFFISQDAPAIIPVEGKVLDDRIAWISEFIDRNGNLIETEQSILDPSNVELMEKMLQEQGVWTQKDNEFKDLTKKIKNFKL